MLRRRRGSSPLERLATLVPGSVTRFVTVFAMIFVAMVGLATPVAAAAAEAEVELRSVAWSEVRQGVLRGEIEAPAERLYRALADFSHWQEFMPFVSSSRVTVTAEGGLICEQQLDLPFPYPDRQYRLHATHGVEKTAEGSGWWVAWQDSSPAATAAGEVRGRETRALVILRPIAPRRTAVEIQLWSDGGGILPRTLQERITARSLLWILDGLRQQVGRCRYDQPIAPGCAEEAPLELRS